MRRIILSLFATGLLAACPGDSGVPPPSPTTPLAGEATPTGGGGSGLSTLSLGDPKILTVVKEQFIQTFGDDSCSVPAGADVVSDVPNILVGDGVRCRQIAWTIGNSGGSCMKDCSDEPATADTMVPPPGVVTPVVVTPVVVTLPVEDPPFVFTPVEDPSVVDPSVVVTPQVDLCTAAFATYTQSTNEVIQAATCESLTLCRWNAGECITCESEDRQGVRVCKAQQPEPEQEPEPEPEPEQEQEQEPEPNRCENLYDPPGGFVAGVWRDHDSVCTKRVRGGKCEALYWVGVVRVSSVEGCSVPPSWCSVLDRGDSGQCKR